MIKVDSNLSIDFSPLPLFFDVLESQVGIEIFYKRLDLYLKDQGAVTAFGPVYPYCLGFLGEHEQFSLIKNSGYWVVAFTERGSSRFLGIFKSGIDATNFFISQVSKTENTFKWNV
jgi:hypothetical protein